MKRILLVALVLVQATGCSSMSHTETGAIGGGLLGGVAGAIVGSCVGSPKTGAVVGAGLGALAGGAAGHSEDRAERRAEARESAIVQAQAARQLSLMDIATMARSGTSDIIIINQIRTTGSAFNLTPDQISWLHTNGVSDLVITEMQARQGVPVIYRQPYPYRRVYVVEPPPPPGVSVGVVYSR